MIKGTYILSSSGVEIGRYNNAITNEGMTIIRSYLANPSIDWCGAISIGCLNNTASASTNTSMDYEITKVPVLLRSVQNNELIVKAAVEADIECEIYELGIYPSVFNSTSNGYDDRLLINFDEEWYDSATLLDIDLSNYSSISRVGSRSLLVPDSTINFSNDLVFDLSGYSSLDNIDILYNVTTTGTNRSITVSFIDEQLPTPGTKTKTIVVDGSTSGYNKITTTLGDFVEANNFNNQVSKISISATADPGAALISLDSIRINDADETDPNFSLVSRSLIGSVGGSTSSDYVKKPGGLEIDIEYRLEISSI